MDAATSFTSFHFGAKNRLGSKLASLIRGYAGSHVQAVGTRPLRRLVLYEMENCPFSRKVREALSMLDIDVEIRPCPEGAEYHRAELKRLGGREQIPMLFDPNTQKTLYNSNSIIEYLFERYGRGKPPRRLRGSKLTNLSSMLASYLRRGKTLTSVSAHQPTLPLELWSYEPSSECRLVREVLGRYALPYVLYNAAKNSPKRTRLRRIAGRETLPYLVDPNRGVSVAGTERIAHYLHETYGVKDAAERPSPLRRKGPAHRNAPAT